VVAALFWDVDSTGIRPHRRSTVVINVSLQLSAMSSAALEWAPKATHAALCNTSGGLTWSQEHIIRIDMVPRCPFSWSRRSCCSFCRRNGSISSTPNMSCRASTGMGSALVTRNRDHKRDVGEQSEIRSRKTPRTICCHAMECSTISTALYPAWKRAGLNFAQKA